MVDRVVSTKLSEEIHSKLLDVCNRRGCTPFALLKESIMEKIKQEEQPKETSKSQEMTDDEIRKVLKVTKSEKPIVKESIEIRRKPTLEETIEHMKNCRNSECKYGKMNILKNFRIR